MILPRAAFPAALLLAAPGPALAHGGLPGGGGILSGALHPFVAVEHLALLLALGLLAGQVPREARPPAFASVGLGLAVGLALPALAPGLTVPVLTPGVLALALVTGLVLALAWRPPAAALAALAGLAGLAVGLDTDLLQSLAQGEAPLPAALGVGIGVYLIVLDAAALSALAVRPPYTLAPRIAGSWVAAIALMLLALAVGPGSAAA